MATIDTSVLPYNNKFNRAKRFSEVLFRPGRPALSQELLEEQSIKNDQLNMLGSTVFAEGAVVSGMQVVPVATTASSTSNSQNLFSVATLSATNATLSTTDYVAKGNINFTSAANVSTDQSAMGFSVNVTKGLGLTIAFNVTKTTGILDKLNLDFDSSQLTLKKWTLDGVAMLNSSLTDMASANYNIDSNNNQVNINTTTAHKVVVVFDTLISGNTDLALYINAGYDNSNSIVGVVINNPMAVEGTTEKPYVISSKDTTTASSTEKVKNYKVTAGRVWLGGLVREFDEQTFSITGTGKETIGLALNETIVTSADDKDLLDDTPGTVTNGLAGADRLKYQVVLTYNDNSAVDFVVFQDNVINQSEVRPDYTNITKILAKRTYDQSGSFRTEGFEVHPHLNSDSTKGAQDPMDANKILLDVDKGQAYVQGYSIATDSTTNLRVRIANDTGTTTNEGHYYKGDGSKYELINQPVKAVNGVSFTSRKTVTYTRPVGGGNLDTFTPDNVTYIHQVYDNTQGYTAGVDFTYINNVIHWGQDLSGKAIPGAHVPNQGQSYTVVYDYSTNAVQGTDYKVVSDGGTTYIDIDSAKGAKPVAGSTITVSYVYFEARIDMIRITMDNSNPFKIIEGQPAPLASVTPPVVNDPYSLELGYVLIYPNSHNAVFTMQTVTRQTFETLQQWGRRLTNTEYNLAIANMNQTVARSEDPSLMKDVLSDSFNTINNRDDDNSTVAYDFENGEILLPSQAMADLTPTIDYDNSQVAIKGSSVAPKGSLVTPPYHEEVAINQPISTGTTNVNEFNIFSANGTLTINPSSDNWIDTDSTTVTRETDAGKVSLNKWWYHTNGDVAVGRTGKNQSYADAISQQYQYSNLQGINWINEGLQTGYMLTDGGSTTTESAIEYMRQRTISFVAQNLPAFSDGYKITIDGVVALDPTPASDDYKGTNGTFKTNANGEISGTFTIPGGVIRCGTRTVKIIDNANDQASTNYIAQGTLKTTENIIEKRVYSVDIVDPLAQSFTIGETRQLSSVDLYFYKKADKSDTAHTSDLIVQIRELSDDGYPNNVVRTSVTLTPDQIQVSDDGSLGTRVTFTDSVTLTGNRGYAIVLISDSNAYEVFSATKGQKVVSAGTSATVYNTNPNAISNKDPNATGKNVQISNTVTVSVGDTLTSAPNSNGVMFISNNAQTWTADGTSSIKFAVNVCKYQQNGEIIFDPIVIDDWIKSSDTWVKDLGDNLDGKSSTSKHQLTALDRLAALTSYLTYQNTSMNWYIRVLQGNAPTYSGASVATALANCPWLALPVNNNNQAKPSATSTDGVPAVTSDDSIQTVDGEVISFKNTYAMQLKADFNSDDYIAPVLTTEDLSLVAVLTGKAASYESINVDESGDAAFNYVKLQYDAYIPEVGTALPQVNPMYSVDGGATWYNFPSGGGTSSTTTKTSATSSTPTSTKAQTNYFTRYVYEAVVPTATDQNHLATQFKVRLYLQSPNNFRTPRVRKLSCYLQYDPSKKVSS